MNASKTYERCRHFNGHQHTSCAAGVLYADVRDDSGTGMRRWPCLTLIGREPATTACAHRSCLTQAELDAETAQLMAAGDRALAAIASGRCHVCGKAIEPSKKVGRCVYGACGHRLGQVS